MNNLKFSKVGWFADEMSARYEAVVNENIKVRVFKDTYFNGFRFEFLTSNGYDLGNLTGDYLCSFWNNATKKQAVNKVIEILKTTECFIQIEQKAIEVKNTMSNYGFN
jgi:hypothetical protein